MMMIHLFKNEQQRLCLSASLQPYVVAASLWLKAVHR